MEKVVNFAPWQSLPAGELTAVQDSVRSSLDRVVREMLFDEGRFSGFNVAKVDALNIKVGKGALVRDGAVYAQSSDLPFSLVSMLPPSGSSKVILVVVAGNETISATQQVRFLTDVVTRATQTRPHSTRKFRQASVALVEGVASASPTRPALLAGQVIVSSFVLAANGIVDDPERETANEIFSLEKAMTAIALLQAADKKQATLTQTLRSEIAGLAKALSTKAEKTIVNAQIEDLLIIKQELGIPDTASIAGYDDFASDVETDLTKSTAIVESGYVRFGDAERKSQLIELFDPNEPKIDKSESGLILPKSTDELRLAIDERESDIAIGSYAKTNQTLKLRKKTRSYLWYQEKAPFAEVEAKLKQKASVRVLNPKTDQMETLDLRNVDWTLIGRGFDNLPGFSPYYRIDVDTETWDLDTTTINIAGASIAESLLCAQSGWHKRFDVWFTDVDATGDVTIAVCKAMKDGISPDWDKVLSVSTRSAASLKKGRQAFYFDPYFKHRGERYIHVIKTNGNHKVAISKTNDYANGTLSISTDGIYYQGQIDKDLCCWDYGCKFSGSNVVVDIKDITLPGGIRALQAVLTGFQPKGTDLVIQARINGVYRNVSESDAAVLSTAPTQIPLRLVFVGTRDLMPGIDLTASRMIATRPNAMDVHVAKVRTLPGGVTTNSVKGSFDTIGFDETIHALAPSILYGAGYATQANFTAYSRKELKPGRHRHYFTVAGLPGISAYQLKAARSTSNTARTFNMDTRKDYAQ